jgi:hypothetical protein
VLAGRTARIAGRVAAALLVPVLACLPAAARAGVSPGYYATPPESLGQFNSELANATGLAMGQGTVTMALLSTGVDPNALGLAGKVITGPDYTSAPGMPLNRLESSLLAQLVAGGTASPVRRLISLRVSPQANEPGASAIYKHLDELQIDAKAIRYAVDHGAQVIYVDAWAEWSGKVPVALSAAVSYAMRKNVVIIAPEPADPNACGGYWYPVGLPGVIGIGEVTLSGDHNPVPAGTTTSACNNSIVVSAPSDEQRYPGTSAASSPYGEVMAGALVGYTVALIKQRYPGLSPALVERALAMSARSHPAGGYNPAVGFGVLDPYQAVVDAGTLTGVTVTAPVWLDLRDAVVADGAHFGDGPLPAVISALPSAGSAVGTSWAGITVGALLVILGIALALYSRRRRA